MRIATFNINGVNGRLPVLLEWLGETRPDIVCLQELKCPGPSFPRAALQKAGYGAVVVGERAYNGVAILAKGGDPIVTRTALPGEGTDKQARYVEAAVRGLLIANVYAPNGNPHPGPRFEYKLRWLARLNQHALTLLQAGVKVVLAGDFNVVPTDRDLYNPSSSWKSDALLHPEGRALFSQLLAQGWLDALRSCHPDARIYTFWDYLREAYKRDAGLRIDHLLLSRALQNELTDAGVDKHIRGLSGASDHAPTWIELDPAEDRRTPQRRAKVSARSAQGRSGRAR